VDSRHQEKHWIIRATQAIQIDANQDCKQPGPPIFAEKAWRCYLRAAACFEQGKDVERDLQEARRLYRLYFLALAQRDAKSSSILESAMSLAGESTRTRRRQRGCIVSLPTKAMLMGSAISECYHTGLGVKQDIDEAVRLYRLSANQGNSRGQCNLGVCSELGTGVKQDIDEAVRLYGHSA